MKSFLPIFYCWTIAVVASSAVAAVNFVDVVPDQFVTKPGSGPGLISQFDIDFNGDGGREVRVFVSASSTTGFNVLPMAGNNIMSVPSGPVSYWAYPVAAGQSVGSVPIGSGVWAYDPTPGILLGACVDIGCSGFFTHDFVGFVGVEFLLPDGLHYGVIEIEGLEGNGLVRSYAWETTPNTPIIAGAPEPGRVGLILLAMLLCVRRRRR
jgi:hypothetical protein